ncbi:hypothetical protein V9T40_008661 [Parthenolecanium corni]|uniref:18 kDa Sin3-associated polypeptide n=1 Tax=Parthenolecanium corni TaxID=536013 RepID=A0AAN9Y8B1_9HEMI
MISDVESDYATRSKMDYQSNNDDAGSNESDSNNRSSNLRTGVAVPVVQSTVKVEGRKENNIDRYKTCPLLLRVFYNYNHHHNPIDYKNKQYPKNELQIHTWMDASLSEILINLQRKNRKIRRSGTVIKFQIISPDPTRPRYKVRDVGSIKIDYKGPDDLKTLHQCRYSIGDFIDLCIKLPKN